MKEKSRKYLILVPTLFIIGFIMTNLGSYLWENQWIRMQDRICQGAEKLYMPGLYYVTMVNRTSLDYVIKWTLESQPVLSLIQSKKEHITYAEDKETWSMLIDSQNRVEDSSKKKDDSKTTETNASKTNISVKKLKNYKYLMDHFYTVDSTTKTSNKQINYQKFMKYDMKLDSSNNGPKILIYHTHSQEEFADSVAGDPTTTIVGVGDYLMDSLNEKGISTIHDQGVYDMINGKMDRSKAYGYAEKSVRKILKKNPSIEVVIDLHRDGVSKDLHLMKKINGKKTARIMFFNGLSYSKMSGKIDYLNNPYINDNLAFSFQMQLECEKKYPGWARKIYLRAYRYNMHLMPKDLLIEAGAQTNTLQEMKNAMDLLSDTLYSVLKG